MTLIAFWGVFLYILAALYTPDCCTCIVPLPDFHIPYIPSITAQHNIQYSMNIYVYILYVFHMCRTWRLLCLSLVSAVPEHYSVPQKSDKKYIL